VMAKQKYIYQGSVAADVVLAPTGRSLLVSPGDSVTLLANEAKSILGSGDWVPAPTTTTKPIDRKLES